MKIKRWTIIDIDFNENEQKKVNTKVRNLFSRQGFSDFISGNININGNVQAVEDGHPDYDWGIQITRIDYIKEV